MTARHDQAPGAGEPASRRDRTAEAVAARRREIERGLAELVTPEMLAEHRRTPVGCHSPSLSWVLAYFRQSPTAGKLVVQSRRTGASGAFDDDCGPAGAGRSTSLRILRLSGRPGVAHEVIDGSFLTEDEALDAVFLRRLAEYGMVPAGHPAGDPAGD